MLNNLYQHAEFAKQKYNEETPTSVT